MPHPPAPPNEPGRVPGELTDATRGERLQKVLAKAGVASRRHCETLIREGRITVNNEPVADLPAWVDPARDRIKLDGKPLRNLDARRQHPATYIILHKPRRVITTTDDPEGRTAVNDLIDQKLKARVFPVGRLDADSTGLVLLTDDGELAHRLTHPSYEVPKEYLVTVRGRLEDHDIAKLRQGLLLTDQSSHATQGKVKRAAMEQIRIVGREKDRTHGDRTRLSITLREGQNREIRRLLERRGVKVRRLKRLALGPLRLKRLPAGQWRCLTDREAQALKRSAGLRSR